MRLTGKAPVRTTILLTSSSSGFFIIITGVKIMKQKKVDTSGGKDLVHNPFAVLGEQLGVAPSEDEPEAAVKESTPEQPMLLVRLEKRKKGKVVTVIYHLAANHDAVLKKLKQKLAAGGTRDGETLELQGDHRRRASGVLREMGYRIRES
jgi:translation initiation factor 1